MMIQKLLSMGISWNYLNGNDFVKDALKQEDSSISQIGYSRIDKYDN